MIKWGLQIIVTMAHGFLEWLDSLDRHIAFFRVLISSIEHPVNMGCTNLVLPWYRQQFLLSFASVKGTPKRLKRKEKKW